MELSRQFDEVTPGQIDAIVLDIQKGLNMSENPLVIFSHGKESGPWGSKIMAMAQVAMRANAHVASLDYSDILNPEERVTRLLSYPAPTHDKLILVGSSMGGYVSAVASRTLNPHGLFLLAPAVNIPGYAEQDLRVEVPHALVIHGCNDEIIPIENSKDFCSRNNIKLIVVDGDHRLNEAIPIIEDIFSGWLSRVLAG